MKKILFLLLSFHSFAFAASDLFYIDSKKALEIAKNTVKDRKPEIFAQGLKLQEFKHEFDIQGNVESQQFLKITFLYSETRTGGILDTKTVTVVLDRSENVLRVLTGRTSKNVSPERDIGPEKIITACKNTEDYHLELLNHAEFCKYSTDKCPELGRSNTKVRAVCAEESLSLCFENKKWVSMSTYFGEAPNLDIIRVNQRMGKTKSCALFKRP